MYTKPSSSTPPPSAQPPQKTLEGPEPSKSLWQTIKANPWKTFVGFLAVFGTAGAAVSRAGSFNSSTSVVPVNGHHPEIENGGSAILHDHRFPLTQHQPDSQGPPTIFRSKFMQDVRKAVADAESGTENQGTSPEAEPNFHLTSTPTPSVAFEGTPADAPPLCGSRQECTNWYSTLKGQPYNAGQPGNTLWRLQVPTDLQTCFKGDAVAGATVNAINLNPENAATAPCEYNGEQGVVYYNLGLTAAQCTAINKSIPELLQQAEQCLNPTPNTPNNPSGPSVPPWFWIPIVIAGVGLICCVGVCAKRRSDKRAEEQRNILAGNVQNQGYGSGLNNDNNDNNDHAVSDAAAAAAKKAMVYHPGLNEAAKLNEKGIGSDSSSSLASTITNASETTEFKPIPPEESEQKSANPSPSQNSNVYLEMLEQKYNSEDNPNRTDDSQV